MAANSLPRRVVKKALSPLLDTRLYVLIQAVSKASDIWRGSWTEPELDLVPLAVRPGETALDLGANFGLYSYHIGRAVGDQGHVFVDAKIVRLDEALSGINALSLIKADIEGSEYFAFQGAERLIDHHLPTIICEINPWYLEGFSVKSTDLCDFLFKKGYQLFFYSSDQRLLSVDPHNIVEDNYVFIHPSRQDRFGPIWTDEKGDID